MKSKLILSFLTALAVSLGAAMAADKEETPLSKEMTAMNKALRTIKRQLADPAKKEDSLQLLAKIKANLDKSHELDPRKTSEQTDKPAYTKKFKEQIVELGKTFGELEAAIKVDDQAAAKKALDRISELKDKGHKDFGVDDD